MRYTTFFYIICDNIQQRSLESRIDLIGQAEGYPYIIHTHNIK